MGARATCRAWVVIGLAALLSTGFVAPRVDAQTISPPLAPPSEPPKEIPIPDAPEAPILEDVPPLAPTPIDEELRFTLREIEFRGNTVLDVETLRAASEPYLGRPLDSADLEALRQKVTRLYIDRGYVTSGAALPDQDLRGGKLLVRMIEGRIVEVRVSGTKSLADPYVVERVAPDLDAVVNVKKLEERLQFLRRDAVVENVHAELRPGLRLGESVLLLEIVEARLYALEAEVSNFVSPVIGEWNGGFRAGSRNVTGWGDEFEIRARFSEGLNDVRARWGAPVTRHDTRVGARLRWAESRVIEGDFEALDIKSDFISAGFELSHPVYRTLEDVVRLGVLAEWRRGRNFVGGYGFSFAEGSDRGESIVAPLRLAQEWLRADRLQVIRLRSIVSIGLPILGATDVAGSPADAEFVSWILQGQWARRLGLWHLEALVTGNLQLANDPLLSIEQYALGGHASVRGYRESQLVRDNGFATSFELRLPVWRRPDGRSVLQLAAFSDVGRGWNDGARGASRAQNLASVGLGLRGEFFSGLRGEFYWGQRLIEDFPNPKDSAQDYGLHLRITSTWD